MTYKPSTHHSFDINLATQLGSIELAILVHHFQFWVNYNKKLGRNFKDGRTWTFQTRKEIAAHFPYMSIGKVTRLTNELKELGILRKGKFNKKKMDKTLWYAFENEEIFTIVNSDKSIVENDKCIVENDKAIPESKPYSKSSDTQSLGLGTKALEKMKVKNLETRVLEVPKFKTKEIPPGKRWKLAEDQEESFNFLKTCNIDAEDRKLCFWAKTWPLQRLIDVYNEAKHNNARSLRKYMSNLLEGNKVVPNANIEANTQLAKDFIKENQIHGCKIYKKYVKIKNGADYIELDLNVEPHHFFRRLLEKFEDKLN